MKKEFIVGLFLVFGVIAIVVSVFLIRDIKLQKGYKINLYFDDVGNLMERAWVRIRGVKIGRVEKISVEENKAKVVVWINAKVKLYRGIKAKISSTGVLGVKYIEIIQGDRLKGELKNGEDVYDTEDVVSIDNAISEGISSLRSFSNLLSDSLEGKNLPQKIEEILENLESISKKIDEAITAKELKDTIKNINTAGQNISEFFREVDSEELKSTVLALKNISQKLESIIEDAKSTQTIVGQIISDKESGRKIADTLNSIKLITEKADKTLNRMNMFTAYWDFGLRYEIQTQYAKSDVGLEVYPNSKKFYFLGINNISTENLSSGVEKLNSFSIGLGGSFYDLFFVYGGIIKSYGGVGVKILPFGYKSKLLEFQAETYNFSKSRSLPQIDIALKLKMLKWLSLGIRYEDVSVRESINASLNIKFEDEDIAYLLGLIGLAN
ncbi:MAG: MlaD family protein [Endomicrobia bacterium]|nr:MlaD family protein [Endomicrobiia bacterium]